MDAMEKDAPLQVVKYVGQKISKIRWRPSSQGRLQAADNFVTGGWDDKINLLTLWNTAAPSDNSFLSNTDNLSCEPEPLCEIEHPGSITDIQFIDSKKLVTSSSTGDILLHAVGEYDEEFETLQHWRSIHSFDGISSCSCTSISVNQIGIVSVGEDGVISVLPMESSKPTRKIGAADSTTINAVIHIRSFEIVTVGNTGQLKLWDLRQTSDKPTKTMYLSGDRVPIMSVDRHPDQSHVLITGSADGVIGIWDIRQEKSPVTLIDAHKSEVWEVKFHPTNPDNLFTCSEDGSVWYWNGSSMSSSTTNMPRPTIANESDNLLHQREMQSCTTAWLYVDANKHKIETFSLLPFNRLPVNTIDIESRTLLCGTDGEAIIMVKEIPIK